MDSGWGERQCIIDSHDFSTIFQRLLISTVPWTALMAGKLLPLGLCKENVKESTHCRLYATTGITHKVAHKSTVSTIHLQSTLYNIPFNAIFASSIKCSGIWNLPKVILLPGTLLHNKSVLDHVLCCSSNVHSMFLLCCKVGIFSTPWNDRTNKLYSVKHTR